MYSLPHRLWYLIVCIVLSAVVLLLYVSQISLRYNKFFLLDYSIEECLEHIILDIERGSMPHLWHIFPFGTCSSIIFVCGICQNIAYTNCPNRQSLSIDQTVMSLSMIRCIRSGSRIQHGLLTKINTFRKLLENGSPTAQASNWFEIRIT